ncbi:MAG: asparagine--tRNA ligase [Lachnospiraceae bacterium]|nr:asparagine--tRNA ligase [Lachnospiraceae bacterium]MCI7597085.1 asparagine--tRNA ligase [Lachnospiraceae bacterium]MDD7051556.1 asparagine--tRNA ligase [Lachnospiraceae bacterium]MDY3223988.1 asparagine--tRNA ligase [Lachnospiraceae bacterium]
MELTSVKELYRQTTKYADRKVTVGGWVRNNRDSKTFGFLVVNDGTFFEPLQVVYTEKLSNFEEIAKLNIGAAVVATGTILVTPGAKQPFEMQAEEILIEGASTADYPLQKKRHTFEYLRTISHLRARTNTFQAVFRIRSLAAYAIHQFFQEREFVYVHTPIITGSDCEGAGEMFQVTTLDLENVPKTKEGQIDFTQDFFGKPANLTVSGQLNAETYAFAFKNVYTFGPTFRAENSNTTRHAAEFWMIEPEMCFADLKDDMLLAESMIKYVIRYVLENAPEEMNFFNQFVDKGLIERLNHVVNSEFGHVTYTEAIKILEKHNDQFDYKVFWGCDLQTEHERFLTEQEFKRPVFVTDYPKEIKAFYMKLNEDGRTVAAMDCLVPGIGEIIGGSQREDDLELLEKRMEELGLNKEDYGFYLDLRKYGSARHAGFGLGFERCIMYLTGMGNIRDVVPFPRTVNNCEL